MTIRKLSHPALTAEWSAGDPLPFFWKDLIFPAADVMSEPLR
jgi:hypothetical protein